LGVDQIRALGEHLNMKLQIASSTEEATPENALISMLDALKNADISDLEIRNGAHVALLVELLRGGFDSKKQECFYADQLADDFREPSTRVRGDVAAASLRLATTALYNIYVSLRRRRRIVS
jgi:hypothetical protein